MKLLPESIAGWFKGKQQPAQELQANPKEQLGPPTDGPSNWGKTKQADPPPPQT